MQNAQIIITVGVPGSGKTYTRSRYVIDELLPDSNAQYLTNLPLFPETIQRLYNLPRKWFLIFPRKSRAQATKRLSDIKSRVHILDRETILSWAAGRGGPWDLPEHLLRKTHLAIDEAHHIVGTRQKPEVIAKWNSFLSEVRHEGMTVEFITQNENSIHQSIKGKVAKIHKLTDGRLITDKFFGIEMGDWLQLSQKFLGSNCIPFVIQEWIDVAGKKKKANTYTYYRDDSYFQFYDSYAPPLYSTHQAIPETADDDAIKEQKEHVEKGRAGAVTEEPWQVHDGRWGYLTLLGWFWKRNYQKVLSSKPLWIAFFVMFLWSGGGALILNWFLTDMIAVNQKGLSVPQSVSQSPEHQKRVQLNQQMVLDQESQDVLRKIVHSDLRVIAPDHCVFKGCKQFKAGARVPSGAYQGLRILAFDYANRSVVLEGGVMLTYDTVIDELPRSKAELEKDGWKPVVQSDEARARYLRDFATARDLDKGIVRSVAHRNALSKGLNSTRGGPVSRQHHSVDSGSERGVGQSAADSRNLQPDSPRSSPSHSTSP